MRDKDKTDVLLETLMDNTPDSIYFKDLESRFVKVNKAKAEHSKTRPEDMIGKTDFDFLPEEEAKKAFSDDMEVMKAGKPIKDRIEKLTRKDGTEVWVSATKMPWYDNKGKIIGTIGISRDITERKKDDEALKENKEKIKRDYYIQSTTSSILRIALEPFSLEDQLGHILDQILSIPWLFFQSKGCIYLVEDEPEILVMKALSSSSEALLTTCRKVPFGKCLCGRAASTREIVFADSVDDHHEIICQDMLPHGNYCVPILYENSVLGVICVYLKEGHKRNKEDEEFLSAVANTLAGIIERKKAEEELKEYRGHLEELVKERTNKLSVLIHDLKGSLIPNICYTKKLMNGKVKSEEDSLRMLKIVHETSQNLLQVIEDTSKSLKDKSTLQLFCPEEIDFNEILVSVIKNSLPEIESGGIELFVNQMGKEKWDKLEKIPFKADPYQLKTSIENLLGNAIKYAKSTIKVASQKTEKDIVFAVSDDGPGIPEKYHKKIFDEYFQVPGSKKGTGLGLHSVKKVVDNHHGEIAVHSSSSTGTTFEITFPVSKT